MRDDLLSCPFCGGESELNHVNTACEWLYEVRCPECGCGTDYSDTSDDAIAAWNHRTPVKEDER
jgi:Lar family restriction alleviation protein